MKWLEKKTEKKIQYSFPVTETQTQIRDFFLRDTQIPQMGPQHIWEFFTFMKYVENSDSITRTH